MRAALQADVRGFRAMGRIYANWALSQTFYREQAWRSLGFSPQEDFLVRSWEHTFSRRDRCDLLAQIWTWQHGDISAHADFNGDLAAALRSIREVLLIPCDHDPCFQVEDSRLNLAHLRNAELRPIPSIWGHRAGNPVDAAVIATAVRELLEAAAPL